MNWPNLKSVALMPVPEIIAMEVLDRVANP